MNGTHKPLNTSILTSPLVPHLLLPSTGLVTQPRGKNFSPRRQVTQEFPECQYLVQKDQEEGDETMTGLL